MPLLTGSTLGDGVRGASLKCFGPEIVPLVHCRAILYSGKQLYGYADDSALVAVVPSPSERVAVSESMNRDLNRVSVWCNLWEMELNPRKLRL